MNEQIYKQPKSTPWKVIIPVAIVVILCCLCLAVVGVLAYLGTQGSGPLSMLATATSTPTKIPTRASTPTLALTVTGDWDIYYDWSCTSTYSGPALLTFYSDQSFTLTEDSTGFGTWYLAGNYMDFSFSDSPHAHYLGTLDSGFTYLEGTMSTDDGSNGCWYADKR